MEGLLSKNIMFSELGRKPALRNSEIIEEIKEWLEFGRILLKSVHVSLAEASVKRLCHFSLDAKVQSIKELAPYLAVASVSDATFSKQPVLVVNQNKQLKFKQMDHSNLTTDIFVTLKLDRLKNLKEGSFVRIFNVQSKIFLLPVSGKEECIVFKVDGRYLKFEVLIGKDKETSMELHSKGELKSLAQNISHSSEDGSTLLPDASHLNSSHTIGGSPVKHNLSTRDDYHSQSTPRHQSLHRRVESFTTQPGQLGAVFKSSLTRHKECQISEEQRVPQKLKRVHVASLEPNDRRISSDEIHVVNDTSYGVQLVERTPVVNSRKAGPSMSQNIPTTSRKMNNASTSQDIGSDEDRVEDEPIIETRAVLRRLKYLPGVHHVNVWIKDVIPYWQGCPLDLVTARCQSCRTEQSYSLINNWQSHVEEQKCLRCFEQGSVKFFDLQFKFALLLWDACEREISATVAGEEAEKFLKCSVYCYVREEEIRKKVWSALCRLRDRGCLRNFRRAKDLIGVDIGVTVENGTKKYILLGGALNNLVD